MEDQHGGVPEIRLLFPGPPGAGDLREVAPGILWLRMPMPLRLDHVNLWLFDEPDGWTAIDTGLSGDRTHQIWQHVESQLFNGKPLRRLIATHGHTDHVGAAAWMVKRYDVPFYATLIEWQAARIRYADEQLPLGERTEQFARVHGCDAEMMQSFAAHRTLMAPMLDEQPRVLEELRDGQTMRIGGRDWTIMVCGGHADAHISLYCAADRLLLAGDQILQKISPMIGVFPDQPHANPLGDYLSSLPRFHPLPDDTLVLPSHGLPFYGLHRRLGELEAHHDARLAELFSHLDGARTPADCTRRIFAHAVAEGQSRLAMAETLAHLNYLVEAGRITRSNGAQGQLLFQAA